MNLKLATLDDLPDVVRLAEAFAHESPYASETITGEIEQFAKDLLRDPTKGIVVLYVKDGKPVGLIGGIITKMLMSQSLIATELMWYVEPEHRGSRKSLALKEAFEFWGRKMGAKFIAMSSLLQSNPSIERYYDRTGYKLQEKAYLKVVGA